MTDGPPPVFPRVDPSAFRSIGRPAQRREDERLVTGRGRFSDDFNEPNQLYAAIVRAPYPHARIAGIDTAAAAAMPGVSAVYTGWDCAADGLGTVPHSPLPSTRTDLRLSSPDGGPIFVGPHALLPTDKIRHVGEAVAMVLADSRPAAVDAAEAVLVDYEPLDWVTDSIAAMRPGAAVLWDEVPDNVCVDARFGDAAATDAAFAGAAHTISKEFVIQRVTGVPLEPRAALGVFDADTGRYTLHAGSNGAVRHKQQIAAALNEDPEKLRVLCFDVGGNFGTKNRVYVEFCLVLWAARKLGRPVKYLATRSESFLSDYQGRDLVSRIELALDGHGSFLALRASNLSNVGARIVSLSPLGKGTALVTGSYRIPVADVRARAVFTNTVPTQAYRSSGRPEVNYALERLIDMAADEFGFDALELRRKNLVGPDEMPYRNALGIVYDSGDYPQNMQLALQLSDWDGFEQRARETRARGLRLGRGFANYVESSIGSPHERVAITVTTRGRVEVVVGTQPTGQGHETTFAQVAADLMGIEPDAVDIIYGDTDVVVAGGGSHSGRSMRHVGTLLVIAIDELKAQARRLAADSLAVAESEISFHRGEFSAGAEAAVDWFDLARFAERTQAQSLTLVKTHEMHTPVFPNGCAVCEAEVDPDTGHVAITRYTAVDDVGRVINPLIVDGQTHGSIAQGVGQALWEQCVIDPDSGQPLCGSLMDYALPRADELPAFTTGINEVLSPTNPLGIKSAGEGPTTPALAVVVNAIVDALREYGVRDVALPATPFRVWQAIRDAESASAATESVAVCK
jgi:carbon-monoxide dehydrogenase large subunit